MNIIIFDTETTALNLASIAPIEKQPRIIELGALKFVDGAITAELSQLLDPEMKLLPETTKITGIVDADLAGKPTFKEFYPQLVDFFAGADMMVCHNAPFDCSLLAYELRRLGVDDFPWPSDILCTAQEYTPLFGYRPSLEVLYERIVGSELHQTHRATDDCHALLTILQRDNFFSKIGAI